MTLSYVPPRSAAESSQRRVLTVHAPDWPSVRRGAPGDVDRVVQAAREHAGSGIAAGLLEKWCWLAQLGRYDLVAGRLAEGHADAVTILAEAGQSAVDDAFYGVWASASGGTGLRAQPHPGGWRLQGTLRFCTGARNLDRALVTARTPDGEPLLLDVDVRATGWRPVPGTWSAIGMDLSDSLDVEVDATASESAQVGAAGFYLDRPGFALGGIGVAAVWLGGAAGVLDSIADGLRRFEPNAHQLAHLGSMSTAVLGADDVLTQAAHVALAAPGVPGLPALALRVRSTVEQAARVVLDLAPRVTGPTPLCRDPEFAHRLSDLLVYIRQHHADRDLAALGQAVLQSGPFGHAPR